MLNTTEIWNGYSAKLKTFVRSKVKDKETADDLLQEIFIRVHTKIQSLGSENKLEPWLYQIARNTISDHFRKQRELIGHEKVEVAEETDEPDNSTRFANCLLSLVKLLPEKYREAVTLVELKNLNQLQLAEKLKISYSGAKSRVQRGREILKEEIRKCCNIQTDKYGNVVSHNPSCGTCGC